MRSTRSASSFSHDDARLILSEIGRVLKPGGIAKVQMARWCSVRGFYHLVRRGFSAGKAFEVRYWSTRGLRKAFASAIGPCEVSVHAYFGVGVVPSDIGLMPPRYAMLIRMSEGLRRASRYVPPLRLFADSVFVTPTKPL